MGWFNIRKVAVAVKKIEDRIVLGIVSGIAGNLAKEAVAYFLIRHKLGNMDGPHMAAGIFLPKYKLMKFSRKAKLIGFFSDNIVGGILGIGSVYLLSVTGKDYHRLKGIGIGHFAWTTLYGVLSRLGATSSFPKSEDNNINGIINHAVFGLVTHEVAMRLGAPELFEPKINFLGKPVKKRRRRQLPKSAAMEVASADNVTVD